MPDKSSSGKRDGWRKLLGAPGIIAVTALTTIVAWGTTEIVSELQERAALQDPLSSTVESNPGRVGAFDDLPINLTLPASAKPTAGPGPGCEGFRSWASQLGGVDAG